MNAQSPRSLMYVKEERRPDCGTVCCLGGWGRIILGLPENSTLSRVACFIHPDLGPDLRDQIFWNRGLIYDASRRMRAGTQDHADKSIMVLRGWMANHEGALKSHIVYPMGAA